MGLATQVAKAATKKTTKSAPSMADLVTKHSVTKSE